MSLRMGEPRGRNGCSDDEDAEGSTNEGHQGYSYHGSDDDDDNGGDDEGVNEEDMWGLEEGVAGNR